MSQERFIAGLKHCVEVASDLPDAEVNIRLRPVALRLLLIIAVLDDNLELVTFALDNGADGNEPLTDRDSQILTDLGWTVPNLESLGASDESLSLSESSSEAYPCG
jgi:hypothetical protein